MAAENEALARGGGGYKGSIQSAIQADLASYPPSMKRVADAIIARPSIVLEKTITELAKTCDTSETSVVRLCRRLGFTGFAMMKLQLAGELATESAQFGFDTAHGADIRPTDTLAEMVTKVASAEVLGVQETVAKLDLEALRLVIEAIDRARKVLLFGMGASNAPAQDLAAKLLRIGRVAITFQDAHSALVSATLVSDSDVVIAFSHSGSTRETTEFLKMARKHGATTIAVTNVGHSPLAKVAKYLLGTAVRETTFRSGAMASRIAQLTVVDYVFVGVVLRSYDESGGALKRTFEALRIFREDR